MDYRRLLLFFCVTLGLSQATFVDTLPKCSINNNECLRGFFQEVIKNMGMKGIPEAGLAPADPITIKNLTIKVFNLMNITIIDGFAKGIKDCVINSFSLNLDKRNGHQEMTCDINMKGTYRLFASGPTLKAIFGQTDIHGEGNGKTKLEKLNIKFNFPFHFEKRDGKIFILGDFKNADYTFDIKKRLTFGADNIFVGNDNIAPLVVNYVNENWKILTKSFGKIFVDEAMKVYYEYASIFLERTPMSQFIIEDLSTYLDN